MEKRTFEQAQSEGRKVLPDALRVISDRLASDDGVESAVLMQAADEIERSRKVIRALNIWLDVPVTHLIFCEERRHLLDALEELENA